MVDNRSCIESQEITVAGFIEQRGSFGEKEITVAEYIHRRNFESDRPKKDWERVVGRDGNEKNVVYFPDDGSGDRKIEFECFFAKDGFSSGKTVKRYLSGQIEEVHNISADKDKGYVLRFCDDKSNSLISVHRYKGFIPHGEWESFYPNGKTDSFVTYNMGTEQGIMAKFAENGNKIVCRDVMSDGSRKELDEIKTVDEFFQAKRFLVINAGTGYRPGTNGNVDYHPV